MKHEIGKKGGNFLMLSKIKNRLLNSKSFQALISVLSVLALFFCICAGVLFAMNGLHWISLFSGEEAMLPDENESDAEISIPVHKQPENKAPIVYTENPFCDALLESFPLTEAYYLHIYVIDYVNGIPQSEIYELWRYGEKYRLNRYNEAYEVQSMITCDGECVQIVDYIEMSVKYYLKGEKYDLKNISPLPDFKKMLDKEHTIGSYSEEDDFCSVLYEYPDIHMTDEIKIGKSDGLLYSYINRINGKPVREVRILIADSSFSFDDDMFGISEQ